MCVASRQLLDQRPQPSRPTNSPSRNTLVPPLPALRTPLFVALERFARSAPNPIACIERAEALAREIEPDREYPDEWLVFRILGERRDVRASSLEELAATKGREVLYDLSPFVERLSTTARCEESELISQGGVRADDLAARWKISRKTLDRLRREGLIARRAEAKASRHVLVLMPDVIAAFEKTQSNRLSSAGSFNRLSEDDQRSLWSEFESVRAQRPISITAAATLLAQKHGRSVEGIRLFLKKSVRMHSTSALDDHGPITASVRRVLLRASHSPLDLGRLAKRFDRTRPAVRRAITLARAEALWRLRETGALVAPHSPAFERSNARDSILTSPMVTTGLGTPGPTDLLDLVQGARRLPPPTGAEERARLIAYQFLRFDAARSLDSVDRLHPKPPMVDAIETDLRWAARLKAEILRPHWRLMLQTIEGRVGRRAEEVRPADLTRLIDIAFSHASHAIDLFDPTKGGRIAGPIGLAVDKAMTDWIKRRPSVDASPRRASSLLTFGTVIRDWTLRVAPWQRWLEPDPRLRRASEAANFPTATAAFLAARFGWLGSPPQTLESLALARGLTAIRIAMLEHACLKAARDTIAR